MRGMVLAGVTALAFALGGAASGAGDPSLKLEPRGGGSGSYTDWRAQEGIADDQGSANQALQFISQSGISSAVVHGVEGMRVRELTGLSWEHRKDGRCDKENPRWTLFILHFKPVRFGCALAVHSPGSAPGWIRDSNPQAVIRARIVASAGAKALSGTVAGLEIDFGPLPDSYVFLDNVTVNDQVWTGANDNGQSNEPSLLTGDDLLAAQAPFDDWESMTAEDLLALGLDTSDEALP
jgi:hypothetical protein